MALRQVKPLNDEQWKQVIGELENGPTDRSIDIVEKALQLASHLKEE